MKKTLLMILALSGCVSHVVGSEQPIVISKQKNYTELNKPVEIFVHFNSNARDLYYVGEKKMDYFKTKPAANSPCFINCEYRSEDLRTNLPYLLDITCQLDDLSSQDIVTKQYRLLDKSVRLQKITENFNTLQSQNTIPLCYFLTDAEQFKKKGDVLFAFTEKVAEDEILFEVKLGEDLSNIDAQKIIREFCVGKLRYIAEDQKELEYNKIIEYVQGYRYNSGSLKHGALGYPDQQNKERKLREATQPEKQRKVKEEQERSLFYSKLKKIGGFSMTAIFMYILYQKFYAAA